MGNIEASFWDHLEELRLALLRAFFIIIASLSICFWFYQDVFYILAKPLENPRGSPTLVQEFKRERLSNLSSKPLIHSLTTQTLIKTSPGTVEINPSQFFIPPEGYIDIETLKEKNLVVLGPMEGMAIALKVCFWMGLVLSSPLWIYVLLRFAAPAFKEKEWEKTLPFIGLSLLFLGAGGSFAYFVTIPIANKYLEIFNSNLGVNLWSLAHYLDFTLFLILANALAFELSLILFFLVHFRILNLQTLKSQRKLMIVVFFIVGALLTPPDIITQLMLALPLIGLYEFAIFYAYTRQKTKNYLGTWT